MRLFLCVLLFTLGAFAQDGNWNGYGDTTRIAEFKSTTTKYGKAFPWRESMRLNLFANDTSAAGFANDSLSIEWGYQTGHYAFTTTNSSSPVWVWTTAVPAETLNVAGADTTSVTGYAIQDVLVTPPYNAFVRIWVKGLAANEKGSNIKLYGQVVKVK